MNDLCLYKIHSHSQNSSLPCLKKIDINVGKKYIIELFYKTFYGRNE